MEYKKEIQKYFEQKVEIDYFVECYGETYVKMLISMAKNMEISITFLHLQQMHRYLFEVHGLLYQAFYLLEKYFRSIVQEQNVCLHPQEIETYYLPFLVKKLHSLDVERYFERFPVVPLLQLLKKVREHRVRYFYVKQKEDIRTSILLLLSLLPATDRMYFISRLEKLEVESAELKSFYLDIAFFPNSGGEG